MELEGRKARYPKNKEKKKGLCVAARRRPKRREMQSMPPKNRGVRLTRKKKENTKICERQREKRVADIGAKFRLAIEGGKKGRNRTRDLRKKGT